MGCACVIFDSGESFLASLMWSVMRAEIYLRLPISTQRGSLPGSGMLTLSCGAGSGRMRASMLKTASVKTLK